MAAPSPTVRRRRLGMELRRLREGAGLGIEAAAEHLNCSLAKISRMETGRANVVYPRDVRDLLDLYNVTDQQAREALLTIARESRQKGWWESYSDVLFRWFETYVGLEAAASSIRTYEASVVPGLLQTEDYARAVLEGGLGPPSEVDGLLKLRLARQEILRSDDPPRLWAILDEAVLRRNVGGADVMRAQLGHLVEAAGRWNVTLQVHPFAAGAKAGTPGPFVLLGFPDSSSGEEPGDPDIVYLDHLTGSLYLEKPADIRQYAFAFNSLQAAALTPDDSVAMITTIAAEYRS